MTAGDDGDAIAAWRGAWRSIAGAVTRSKRAERAAPSPDNLPRWPVDDLRSEDKNDRAHECAPPKAAGACRCREARVVPHALACVQHRDQLQAALNEVARATSKARARDAACQLHLDVRPLLSERGHGRLLPSLTFSVPRLPMLLPQRGPLRESRGAALGLPMQAP